MHSGGLRASVGGCCSSLGAGGACPHAALGEQPERVQLKALVLCASLRYERVQEIQVAKQDSRTGAHGHPLAASHRAPQHTPKAKPQAYLP